jgi:cobalamin biosynthesis Mg chelatase CobN
VFTYPKIAETKMSVTDVEAEKVKTGGVLVQPQFEVMLLADYLTNPNASWAPMTEWSANSHGFFYRPEDAEKFELYTGFTPQVALSNLSGKAENQNLATPETVSRSTQTKPSVAPLSTEQPKSAQPPPSAPVLPWVVGLLLLAVFGGVWWKFLRK